VFVKIRTQPINITDIDPTHHTKLKIVTEIPIPASITRIYEENKELNEKLNHLNSKYSETRLELSIVNRVAEDLTEEIQNLQTQLSAYKDTSQQIQLLKSQLPNLSLNTLCELSSEIQTLIAKKIEANSESRNCVVCLDLPKRMILLPCCHLCVCKNQICIKAVSQKCPICRKPVKEIKEAYL